MKNITRLIIDTDIGDDIDDAYALALCLKSPETEVLGVTTVYRNCEQRAKIARAVLNRHGRYDIGVYLGEDFPEREPIRYFDYERRMEDGRPVISHYDEQMMGGIYANGEPADRFLLRTLREAPGEVSILAIGPLTNLAKALKEDPLGFRCVKELLIMGGDPTGEKAEWNFRCDPEAAAAVLSSGVPVKLVGLDMTRQCALPPDLLERYLGLRGSENRILSVMMRRLLIDRPGRTPIMHDGLVASVPMGNFLAWEKGRYRIGTEGEERGFMIPDPSAAEIEVAVSVKSREFLEFMLARLSVSLLPHRERPAAAYYGGK